MYVYIYGFVKEYNRKMNTHGYQYSMLIVSLTTGGGIIKWLSSWYSKHDDVFFFTFVFVYV